MFSWNGSGTLPEGCNCQQVLSSNTFLTDKTLTP